jgi:hypothetical protein
MPALATLTVSPPDEAHLSERPVRLTDRGRAFLGGA